MGDTWDAEFVFTAGSRDLWIKSGKSSAAMTHNKPGHHTHTQRQDTQTSLWVTDLIFLSTHPDIPYISTFYFEVQGLPSSHHKALCWDTLFTVSTRFISSTLPTEGADNLVFSVWHMAWRTMWETKTVVL